MAVKQETWSGYPGLFGTSIDHSGLHSESKTAKSYRNFSPVLPEMVFKPILDEESLVVSNDKITQEDRTRMGNTFVDALELFDEVEILYRRDFEEYYGLPFLQKVYSGIKKILTPHSFLISIPLPFIEKRSPQIKTLTEKDIDKL